MNTRKIVAIALMVLSVLIMLSSVALGSMAMLNKSQAQALPPPQVRNFMLYVRIAEVKMPNGQKIYAFGYTNDPHGSAKIPGPTLVVDEGDTVNVTLVND